MKLSTGDTAPNFTLQNTDGTPTELAEKLGKQQVVLLFFPLAFTGTCTKELCSIRDNMKLYNSLNAEVIAISIDSFFTLKEFKKSENLNFTLLSDFNREVSSDYGTLYDDYFGMKGVAKRSVFVIGKDKKIKHLEILEDSDELPNFDAIQKALQS